MIHFANIYLFRKFIFLFAMFLALHHAFAYALERSNYTVTLADKDAEFVILTEEGDGFKIEKRNLIEEGNQLPALYCTICVPEGSLVVLKDEEGKETEVFGPDVVDLWNLQRRSYKAEQVRVTEGTVAIQSHVTVEGVRKRVGDPVLVSRGNLIKTDPCFKTTFLEFSEELGAEEAAAAQQEALLDPAEDPIDDKEEPPDPDPSS